MTRPISSLVVAWVSAHQRHFCNSTRGIATPEQRIEWEREAEEIIAAHDAEVEKRAAIRALRDAAEDWTIWEVFTASDGTVGLRGHGLGPEEWLDKRADEMEETHHA